MMRVYMGYMRPFFIKDDALPKYKRYLFVPLRALHGQKMSHSVVTQCLSRSIEKAKVFESKEEFTRVSATRIRMAVLTALVSIPEASLNSIANHFMMHKESTSKKFYVQRWSVKEAWRYSMQCFDLSKATDGAKRASAVFEEQQREVPEACRVVKWMANNNTLIEKELGHRPDQDEELATMVRQENQG